MTTYTSDTQAEAENSNKLAAGWVKENLASFVAEPPMIMSDMVGVHKTK